MAAPAPRKSVLLEIGLNILMALAGSISNHYGLRPNESEGIRLKAVPGVTIRQALATRSRNISVDKDEYELAQARAATLGISLAEFIRRAIRVQLGRAHTRQWMQYAGFVETGDPQSSISTDEIVYCPRD